MTWPGAVTFPEARPDRVGRYRRTQLQPAFEPFEHRAGCRAGDFATWTILRDGTREPEPAISDILFFFGRVPFID